MWRPFRNLVNNLQTYRFLSPDLAVRRQVNQQLRSRPCLTPEQWLAQYWTPPVATETFSLALIRFTYECLTDYSGLTVGRFHPTDRLLEDLQFPLVCWFDWGLNLCEDFQQAFNIDITDSFDETSLVTVADLVVYLHQQLQSQDVVAS